jgi:hypothetical protein
MIRIAPSVALVAALNVMPVSSQSIEPELRCTSTDRILSERLRSVIPHQAQISPGQINLVMTRMAAARFDCKHGRADRGLRSYADAETALRTLEEMTAAKLSPTGETASGDVAAQ